MRYRDDRFQYGQGVWYRGPRAEGSSEAESSLGGLTVVVYGPGDVAVAALSSDAADSRLSRCRFELTPTGPGSLELDVTRLPEGIDVTHGTRLDILLDGRTRPVYSGFVQQVPASGSTDWPRKVRAFGFYALLDRLMVVRNFQAAPVWRIVDSLVRELETRTNARIVYNSSRIQVGAQGAGSSFPVSEIRFQRVTYKAAFTQLAGLAGGYEFGVDGDREFFFRPALTEPDAASLLWVRQHVLKVAFTEDSTDIVNRLWIKSGKRQASGDNYLPVPLEAAGVGSSQELHGIREGEATAPSVFDDVDAYRWAAAELARQSVPKRVVSLSGLEARVRPRDCFSPVRLTCDDGTTVVVPKAKVVYTVDTGIQVDIQLGDVSSTPGQLQADLRAAQARAELLQQLTLTQV